MKLIKRYKRFPSGSSYIELNKPIETKEEDEEFREIWTKQE